MKNRHGSNFSFEEIYENVYKFIGNTNFCRFGGKVNTEGIDELDLGFFDPPGGPFISVGHYYINNKKVIQISSTEEGILLKVES